MGVLHKTDSHFTFKNLSIYQLAGEYNARIFLNKEFLLGFE